MAQHIFKGSEAPTTTPVKVGQHYIDETSKVHYISVGTASSDDWQAQSSGDDQSAAEVSFTPDGDIASTNAQAAIVEVRDDADTKLSGKAASSHSHSNSDVTDFDSGVTSSTHAGRSDNPHSVTKSQVELGNVDNLQQLPLSQKGAVNGVATLDGGGKVPSSQLALSNVVYKGAWNASTNNPTLSDSGGGGSQGDYYVVNVAGSTEIDGISDWNIGDWIINNGSVWEMSDHSDSVSSVATKTGAVTLDADDVSETSSKKWLSDTEQSKLAGIEASATADQSGAEIKTAYEAEADTNALTDTLLSKLNGVEASATADQSGSEIKTAYEAEANTNAFTDADESKLDGVAAGATANDTDANLKARVNHTGTQAASTISDFDTEVDNNTFVVANTSHKNTASGNPHSVTKSEVSLGNVDNLQQLPLTQKGEANGVATLDSGGKVPASQLSLSNVVYKGAWNASTNDPTLSDSGGGGSQGDYYVINVAGSTSIDGISDWQVGDWIINNGSVWQKNDNTDHVTSVASKQGAVTLDADDVSETASKKWFSDTEQSKLTGIEASATADQTGSQIKIAYEAEADTNAFTDTEKTKLTGVATGAEVNSELISQAEAEAGTATTERIFSALRVKQSIDALASGGGLNDINFSYGTTAGDFIEVAATTAYTKLDTFLFRGSTALGTPTSIKGLLSSTLDGDLQWRIYDKTNSLVIAEGGLSGDISGMSIYDFGTVSNIPTGIAQFELQVKEVPSGSGKSRCHSLLIGF